MSDVLLTKTQRTAAKRLMPRAGPSSSQAKPLTNAETGTVPFAGIVSTKMGLSPLPGFEKAVHPVADHPSPTWPDVATTLIPEKIVVRRPSRARRIIGTQGLVAILVCMSQVAVQEAPAWGLSMVVHMVTLVTMAIVVVPSTIPHNAQHLVVAPPEQQQIEVVKDISDRQPDTLDETPETEILAMDSNVDQEAVAFESIGDLQAAPAAMDATPLGPDGMPEEDIMAMVHAYGNAYSDRSMSGKVQEVKREGGSEASEKCVVNALRWLANHQMPDGGWSFDLALCPSCHGQCRDSGKLAEARNAATGLALLPFLGRGDTHKESKRYKATINNGLTFLINRMQVGPRGGALNEPGGNMYSQGIATIAICEAYAMTNDRKLLLPAKAALNFIASSQDPKGGGWRYQPRERGDTSVLGWELMALKSGLMANLDIPRNFSQKASRFLDSVQSDGGAVRLSIAGHGQRRHRCHRPSLPHVSRLEAGQPGVAARRALAEQARPLGRKHVLQLLRHPSHAPLGRRGMEDLESADARPVDPFASKAGPRRGKLVHRQRRHGCGSWRPSLLHGYGRDDPRNLLPPHAHLPPPEHRAGLPRLRTN